MNGPTNPDPGTAAGRIDAWLTAWKHHYGDLGIPFGASLIAGPPPSAEPRACADDFGVLLETLAVVLADRAAETVRAEKAEARLAEVDAQPQKFALDPDAVLSEAEVAKCEAKFLAAINAPGPHLLRVRVPTAISEPIDTEYRFVLADGSESEFDLHNGPCDCEKQARDLYAGPWRAAGGWISVGAAAPLSESGCTCGGRIPSRADVEQQAAHADWSDVRAARMTNPDAQAGYREAEGAADLVAVAAILDGVEHYRAWLADAYDPDAPAPDPASALYRRAYELEFRFASRLEQAGRPCTWGAKAAGIPTVVHGGQADA